MRPTNRRRSYYFKDDFKGAIQFEDARVTDVMKKGPDAQVGRPDHLSERLCQTKDEACIAKALEYQVTYYPKPKTWGEVLTLVHTKGGRGDAAALPADVRHGRDEEADDYMDMASIAMDRGSPGDAQHALQMGTDAGDFTGSKAADAQKLAAAAKKATATDQATLAKAEQDANASASGVKNAGAGLRLPRLPAVRQSGGPALQGVSKGGLKNEADTRLNLGIAQLKSGHKDDAVKTFQSVHGSPVQERLASLWAIHAKAT